MAGRHAEPAGRASRARAAVRGVEPQEHGARHPRLGLPARRGGGTAAHGARQPVQPRRVRGRLGGDGLLPVCRLADDAAVHRGRALGRAEHAGDGQSQLPSHNYNMLL